MTDTNWIALDVLLAVLLLSLGWASVATRDLKRGVALFIAFGLLLAVTWARLRAPDLAMAEAAIGAGIAGALLLAALRDEDRVVLPDARSGGPRLWLLNLFCLGLAGVMGWALVDAIAGSDGSRLAEVAGDHVHESGVSNPVTAVLLNFRAYDTLLELAVVLAAVLGVLSLGPARPGFQAAGPVLGSLVRWLLPLLIVTAGYLLWVGAHAPGGAFQAGALLAAAGVALRLAGWPRAGLPRLALLRVVVALGVLVFTAVGLALMAAGAGFLTFPIAVAKWLILTIETAATLAIGATLAAAYLAGEPAAAAHQSSQSEGGGR